MNNKELAKRLKTRPFEEPSEVFVKIENDLFYPIKSVTKTKGGKVLIVCANIKSGSLGEMKPARFDEPNKR